VMGSFCRWQYCENGAHGLAYLKFYCFNPFSLSELCCLLSDHLATGAIKIEGNLVANRVIC
jgi:hypothetical protein